MKKVKLRNHASAQCFVVYSDNTIEFYSYSTLVIKAEKHGSKWHIQCTGTYSQTTRKQIGYFLKEWFPELNYYDMKEIAGTDNKKVANM